MRKNVLIIILLVVAASGWLYAARLYSALQAERINTRVSREYAGLASDFLLNDADAGLKRVEWLTSNPVWKEWVRKPLVGMWLRAGRAPLRWDDNSSSTFKIDQAMLLASLGSTIAYEAASSRTLDTCALIPVIDRLFVDADKREDAYIYLATQVSRTWMHNTRSERAALAQLKHLSPAGRKRTPPEPMMLALFADNDPGGVLKLADDFDASTSGALANPYQRLMMGIFRIQAYVSLGQPAAAKQIARRIAADARECTDTRALMMIQRLADQNELTTDSLREMFREAMGNGVKQKGPPLQPDVPAAR